MEPAATMNYQAASPIQKSLFEALEGAKNIQLIYTGGNGLMSLSNGAANSANKD